jgi:hypothetical protein
LLPVAGGFPAVESLQIAALQAVAKKRHGVCNRFTEQINYFDYQIGKCIFASDGLGFWIVPQGSSLKSRAFRAGWPKGAKRH